MLDLRGWSALHDELYVLSKQGRWSDMNALVDDDVLATFAVIGSVEQAHAELQRRWGPASDSISVALQSPEGIESWGAVL